MIPLSLKIKKETHRKIAFAQDLIVQEVYAVFDKAVFHGGTAIWRCYNGKRFSEDVDFYFPKDEKKINTLFEIFENKGWKILKKKISEKSVYSELEMNRVHVRLEATYQQKQGHLVDYESVDGNRMTVYSLTPEEFIQEKVNAYVNRLKIRDLYDIFFLLKNTEQHRVKQAIKTLVKFYKQPVDEEDLKTIILEGIVPSSNEMMEYIKTWESKNI